jgi:hypothetical protein
MTKMGTQCKNKCVGETCSVHTLKIGEVKKEISQTKQCSSLTKNGNQCKNKCLGEFCRIHTLKIGEVKNEKPKNTVCSAITKKGTQCKNKCVGETCRIHTIVEKVDKVVEVEEFANEFIDNGIEAF